MSGKINMAALGGLILLTAIWSYSWIVMKQVMLYAGAFEFTALRCLCGSLVLLLVLALRGRRYLKPTPFRYTLAIALFQTCGMVGLAQWALISGGAGKVAILSYTMPFWVVIFAALFLGERMRKLHYLAVGVAACGLLLVIQPWQLHLDSMKSALLGIASGICWGDQRHYRQADVCPPSRGGSDVPHHLADDLRNHSDGAGGGAGAGAPHRLAALRDGGAGL